MFVNEYKNNCKNTLTPLPSILYHASPVPITIAAHYGFYNHLPSLAATSVAYYLLRRVVITGATPLFGRRIKPALPFTMLTIYPFRHFVRCPG